MYRRVWYNTMTYLTGCKHLIERFPRTAVPIIPLPGTPPSSFSSRHVAEWFHICAERLCYQKQLFNLQRVSRVVCIKRRYPLPILG